MYFYELLLFVFHLFPLILADPRIVLFRSLQSQHPLIARPNTHYNWTFLPCTFGIEDRNGNAITDPALLPRLSYTVDGLPSWLSFDAMSRSFSGVPPRDASSSTTWIEVTAILDSSSAKESFPLFTSSAPEPTLDIPLVSQLNSNNKAVSSVFHVSPGSALAPFFSSQDPRNGKAGLRVPHKWSFSIGIQGATFSSNALSYSASLANGDALPSWIRFNPRYFTFDGLTPSNGGTQQLEIVLSVSDKDGFSTGAKDSFWLTVANHDLSISSIEKGIYRNVTDGEPFEIYLTSEANLDPFFGQVLWDNEPISTQNILNITLDTSKSSGFVYNSETRMLSGLLEASNSSVSPVVSLPIFVTDAQNITLQTHLNLLRSPSLFKTDLTKNNTLFFFVKPSSAFSFDLKEYLVRPDAPQLIQNGMVSLNVSLYPEQVKNWLLFNPKTLILAGNAPAGKIVEQYYSVIGDKRIDVHHLHYSQSGPMQADEIAFAVPSPPSKFVVLATTQPQEVKVIFNAYSVVSRTTSTLRIVLILTDDPNCPPSSTDRSCLPNNNTYDEGSGANTRRRLTLALTLTFVGLFILAILLAVLCRSHNGLCSGRKKPSVASNTPYVLYHDEKHTAASPSDVEIGVGGKLRHVADEEERLRVSMAETRTEATSCEGAESGQPGHQPSTSSGSRYTSDHVSSHNDPVLLHGKSSGSKEAVVDPTKLQAPTPVTHKRVSKQSITPIEVSNAVSVVHHEPPSAKGNNPFIRALRSLRSSKNESADSNSKSSLLSTIQTSIQSKGNKTPSVRNNVTISKPRPLFPSIGAYLQRDHQAAIAASSLSQQPNIYSMENKTLPLSGSIPMKKRQSGPANASTGSGYRTAQSSNNSNRRHSTEPAESVSDVDLSRTVGNSGESLEPTSFDVPKRRSDFVNRNVQDSNFGFGRNSLKPLPPSLHQRVSSQDSINSIAVISKAAFAVRSPLVEVPSPRVAVSGIEQQYPTIVGRAFHNESPTKTRLVQFVHERRYDDSSSSGDDRIPGSQHSYQGKRERSQKVVVHESSITPPEAWINDDRESSDQESTLAQSIRRLRERSRNQHEKRMQEATGVESNHHSTSTQSEVGYLVPEPEDLRDLEDPSLALGIHYVRSLGSDGNLSTNDEASRNGARNSAIFFTTPHLIGKTHLTDPSDQARTDVAINAAASPATTSSDHNEGPSRVITPPIATQHNSSRVRLSETQHSFISWNTPTLYNEAVLTRPGPPSAPLPPVPTRQATEYFDITDSSSSGSAESYTILHRAGQQRILVGVNENFHFIAPLTLIGYPVGTPSRERIMEIIHVPNEDQRLLQLKAQTSEGGDLPEWLRFDSSEAEFWGVPTQDTRGNSILVKVVLEGSGESIEVGSFIIEVVGR